jgi:two-component system CitB family response regulator
VIRVVVVEDDFRVAQIHVTFTERVQGFRVVGTARSAAEARSVIVEQRPDLVLLDCYLPDESGLDLLHELTTDVIILSAATDAASVRAAAMRGALNYLVKPFTATQLADRLVAYARYRGRVAGDRALSQDDIDHAFRTLHEGDRITAPKGQSSATVRLVAAALRTATEPRSASDIAVALGISRATAQRYLATLTQTGEAEMALRYGSTGRPEHRYRWRTPVSGNEPQTST